MFVLTITVLLVITYQSQCEKQASAVMYGDHSAESYGILTFVQHDADGPVHITGTLTKLNASSVHGFHVHVNPVSDGSPNCTAAGPHFNPYNVLHGSPTANITGRHVGDLGNITTDANGEAKIHIHDSIVQLYNETQSIFGRTVIVHAYRDDGGQGGFGDSNTTGNAGARIICGVIKSNALSIKPIMSVLLMIMTVATMKFFWSDKNFF